MQRPRTTRWTIAIAGVALLASACERAPERTADSAAPPTPAVDNRETAEAGPGWITTKIQSQYFTNPDIKPWNIEVTTSSGGIVTLRGEVESQSDRAEAVRIARETEGVTRVEDQLRIKGEAVATTGREAARPSEAPAGADTKAGAQTRADDTMVERPDAWITTKIQAKYFLDDDVGGRNIDVETRDRMVTLRGTVDSYAARRQAVALARNTDGVREVVDEIRVQGSAEDADAASRAEGAGEQVEDTWIETKIQAKYFLDPDVKGRNIDVEVENGVVTLTGTVAADAQKQTAEQIARETQGVKDVMNQIETRQETPPRQP